MRAPSSTLSFAVWIGVGLVAAVGAPVACQSRTDTPGDAATGDEDCTNGVDDNGDGLIDCADPRCSPGFACVSIIPTGWQGYVALYHGPSKDDPRCEGQF